MSNSNTGTALTHLLENRGLSQRSVATAFGLSQSYVNQVSNGVKLPSPGWLDTVAKALELSDVERVRLHRAAARDHGFEIDLS